MSDDKVIAVFGAGNIGRSFVGQLFARSGWTVIFVDVDPGLVAELNARCSYPVVVKSQGSPDLTIPVQGVSAVDGRDRPAVRDLVARADLAATCVGKAALPRLLPAIADGLLERTKRTESRVPALDLILAENDREAPETVRAGLAAILPDGFPLETRLGIVETSIGKMVPLMRAEDLRSDRLAVFAEAYNTLIVDRAGFLGPVPAVEGLLAVDCIMAYVDRKLFVHNLGHAAVACLGYRADPSVTLIARALALPGVREGALLAMRQAASALAAEYSEALSPESLALHIDDLLERFSNEALGDTVHRVGRDLARKLARSDRIVGSALLCAKRGLPFGGIAQVFAAALGFRARDENGALFPADADFAALLDSGGPEAALSLVCGLEVPGGADCPARDSPDAIVREEFLRALG